MKGPLKNTLYTLAFAGALGTMTACSVDVSVRGSIDAKAHVGVKVSGEDHHYDHRHKTHGHKKPATKPVSQAKSFRPMLYQSLPYGPGQGHDCRQTYGNIAIYAARSNSFRQYRRPQPRARSNCWHR